MSRTRTALISKELPLSSTPICTKCTQKLNRKMNFMFIVCKVYIGVVVNLSSRLQGASFPLRGRHSECVHTGHFAYFKILITTRSLIWEKS